ncbi:MAG: TlpA family protein disulfide reductase [Acidimicrobiia bacterium]
MSATEESTQVDAPAVAVRRGKRRLGPIVAGAVGIVLALFVFLLATRDPAVNRLSKSPLIGKAAPTVTGATLDGQQFDLSSFRGRWVMLNFFASWCVPCQQEHPELVSFSRRHAQIGDAEVVSIVFNDTAAEAKAYFDKNGGEWPVITDTAGRYASSYGVSAPPETYIIDPDGIVRQKFIGAVTTDGLDVQLAALQQIRSGGS